MIYIIILQHNYR